MRKSSVMVASAVLASAALGVGPAYGASGNGAQQEPFYKSNSLCTGPIFDTSGPTFGFAMIKEKTAQNTITTEVSLKHVAPNSTYTVRLIQTPSGADCRTFEAVTVTTNSQGNGNAHWTEPKLPGTTGAFVIVNNAANFSDNFYDTPDYVFGVK